MIRKIFSRSKGAVRITETINIRKFVRCRVGRVGAIVRHRRLGNGVEGWHGHEVAVS